MTLAINQFWFSNDLHKLQWPKILKETVPFLNGVRQEVLLDVAGTYSLNPFLLITKILIEKQLNSTRSIKTDKEFTIKMIKLSDSMVKLYSKYDKTKEKETATDLTEAIWKTFGVTNVELMQLHTSLRKISIDNGFFPDVVDKTHGSKVQVMRTTQTIGSWPFSKFECWQVSPTHYGPLEGAMSSIDMAPALYHGWDQPFDSYNSSGIVYASHDGQVIKWSTCKISIMGDPYETFYAHVKIKSTIKNLDHVKEGDILGTIELDKHASNCYCDLLNDREECSNGPHLHFQIRKNGVPESLDNKILGEYKIVAGSRNYDRYCAENAGPNDCSSLSCATKFIDNYGNGNTYCPTIANSGKYVNDSVLLRLKKD